jgi:hypothetical protein
MKRPLEYQGHTLAMDYEKDCLEVNSKSVTPSSLQGRRNEKWKVIVNMEIEPDITREG